QLLRRFERRQHRWPKSCERSPPRSPAFHLPHTAPPPPDVPKVHPLLVFPRRVNIPFALLETTSYLHLAASHPDPTLVPTFSPRTEPTNEETTLAFGPLCTRYDCYPALVDLPRQRLERSIHEPYPSQACRRRQSTPG